MGTELRNNKTYSVALHLDSEELMIFNFSPVIQWIQFKIKIYSVSALATVLGSSSLVSTTKGQRRVSKA